MELINIHVHTKYSHDGKGNVDEICEEAIRNKLSGFAVTDHCDCEYADDIKMYDSLLHSFDSAKKASEKYQNIVTVVKGIEIGEAIYNPEFAEKIINAKEWDVILGSVHAVRFKDFEMPFSTIDFTSWTEDALYSYIKQYFEDVKETVITTDFDILSHLTVVYRYIIHKYSRSIDTSIFLPQIEEILKIVIKHGKTLEVNTSGMSSGYLMPESEILKLYFSLGGTDISIGSDSHSPDTLCSGLSEAINILKDIGFTHFTYYINRKPCKTAIK